MPKVSVIMAVHNGEKYLKESIDSVLNQTFGDFEFIIIDDASTDASAVLIDEYTLFDDRVRLMRNITNLGLTKSLNLAIKKAQGEYIARMDADDIAFMERFQKQVEFLDSHPDYGLVGSSAEVIDENGVMVDTFDYEETDVEIKRNLIKWNPIIHPVVMMRKDVLERVGGYDESFRFAQDYDLWFRLSPLTKMANLPDKLLYYRVSKKSITASSNKAQATCALRARWNAIRSGTYSPFHTVYLIRPILGMLLPKSFKQMYK